MDDSPFKLSRTYGNHVLVGAFLGDPADEELARLAPYLVDLAAPLT